MPYKFKDETGKRYGMLLVISKATNDKYSNARWNCICDCGKETIVGGANLRKGDIRSCGCMKRGKPREGIAPLKKMFRSYKNGAKARGFDFELTFEEFKNLCFQPCEYCGSIPSTKHYAYHRTRYSKGENTDEYQIFNGIDRINSNIGYVIENCVPCCTICNRAKNDLTLEEFKNWVRLIYSKMENDVYGKKAC